MKEERMEILLVLISILYRYVVKSYKDLKKSKIYDQYLVINANNSRRQRLGKI